MRTRWLVALLALAGCGRDAQDAPAPVRAAHAFSPEITPADLAEHVRTLSSDAFAGRGPSAEGERATTAYIAAELVRIGLEPGADGAWLQRVPMVEAIADPRATLSVQAGERTIALAQDRDIVIGTRTARDRVQLAGSELVFVGYGVTAPEHEWDDYAGIDVRGKTVLVLVNDPGFLRGDETLFRGAGMTYYGRWTYKFEEAARHGARAALLVHDEAAAGYGWDVVRNSWSGPQFALAPSVDPEPRLDIEGWISAPAAKGLFAAAGHDLDALRLAADTRGFTAAPLHARVHGTLESTIHAKASDNVVGVLRGDALAHEALVYVAHWDHLGRRDGEPGDAIYNGAIDNATGVAGVLELAGELANGPRPARTIVFLLTTLEEAGLLGSRHYVEHPAVPIAQTVAAINLDALPVRGRTRDVAVIGLGQSDLDALLADVLRAQDRVVVAEGSPEKGFYYRSDHFSFARRSVPALYARAGYDLREGGFDAGRRAAADYIANRYHKPGDGFDPRWDFSGLVEDVEALHRVGLRIANGEATPQWSADSEFRAANPIRCVRAPCP